MPSPVQPAPPYVPIRATRWPTRRAPRWVLLAGAGLLAIAVAVGLAHRPTQSQRAADLRAFLHEMTTDVQSCAGGVRESLTALHTIEGGASGDVRTAVTIAGTGAANCSPANNELLVNLENYQVPESLYRYHLRGAVTGLVDWAAPDAQQVQADVGRVLTAPSPAARAGATAALRRDLARLDAQRSAVAAVINAAIAALHPGAAPPRLPG